MKNGRKRTGVVPGEEKHDVFAHYRRVAEMLGTMFAPFVEVILHDYRPKRHTVVAVYNGHITGRKIGDGPTDLGLRRLQGEELPDEIFNYSNEAPSGTRLKSSSLAFRNERGEVVGALCLNMDLSYFSMFGKLLDEICRTEPSPYVEGRERFRARPPKRDLQDAIEGFLVERGWLAQTLSREQKLDVIRHVRDDGYFSTRGAAGALAQALKVTRASIYNYLRELGD